MRSALPYLVRHAPNSAAIALACVAAMLPAPVHAEGAKGSIGVGVQLSPGGASLGAGAGAATTGAATGQVSGAAAANATAQTAAPAHAATAAGSNASAGSGARNGVSPYSPAIQKGNAAYAARDFAGAIVAYQSAIKAAPNDPLGHYLLGEAELAAGNLSEADASWSTGLRFANDNDSLHGKLLFVIADLRERQGKWTEAKQAWADYAQFVSGHPQAMGYAATATERQKRIDAHNEIEAKYAPVRQRIEDRKKEADKPVPDDSPQRRTKPSTKSSGSKK